MMDGFYRLWLCDKIELKNMNREIFMYHSHCGTATYGT